MLLRVAAIACAISRAAVEASVIACGVISPVADGVTVNKLPRAADVNPLPAIDADEAERAQLANAWLTPMRKSLPSCEALKGLALPSNPVLAPAPTRFPEGNSRLRRGGSLQLPLPVVTGG